MTIDYKIKFTNEMKTLPKTYKDACSKTGDQYFDDLELIQMGLSKDEIAYRKLKTIAKALNEGEVLDIYDINIERWHPWFACNGSPSGFAFSSSLFDYSDADAGCGSRLAVKSGDLSDYFGTQFVDIWRDLIG